MLSLGQALVDKGYAEPDLWAVALRGHLSGSPLWPQLEGLAAANPDSTLLLYRSPLPFAQLLVQRAAADCTTLVPRDSETGVFLQDIPLIDLNDRSTPWFRFPSTRKALLTTEGLCLVVAPRPDQVLLYAACLHHAVFVSYLADLLQQGKQLASEDAIPTLIQTLADPIEEMTPLADEVSRGTLYHAGQQMVDLNLVDSVFGNASFRDGHQLFISGTGIALDQLAQGTVQVHLSIPGASDRKASSELPSHRAIYQATDGTVILHGHSRFSIALSLAGDDALPYDVPMVQAPPGSQEMADRLSRAMRQCSLTMVEGHGPFATGQNFNQALNALIDFENQCRKSYLERLQERLSE